MPYKTSLSAVAVVLAVAGCGGSGGGASGDKSAAGVRATMRAYIEDVKNDNLQDACNLMTHAEQIEAGGGNASNCALRTVAIRALFGAKGIALFEAKLPQLPISVSGDQATAPPLSGSGPSSSFVYRGGRWLLSSS